MSSKSRAANCFILVTSSLNLRIVELLNVGTWRNLEQIGENEWATWSVGCFTCD
jgi:hypothetical protein